MCNSWDVGFSFMVVFVQNSDVLSVLCNHQVFQCNTSNAHKYRNCIVECTSDATWMPCKGWCCSIRFDLNQNPLSMQSVHCSNATVDILKNRSLQQRVFRQWSHAVGVQSESAKPLLSLTTVASWQLVNCIENGYNLVASL